MWKNVRIMTPPSLIDAIKSPEDVRPVAERALRQATNELRSGTTSAVTGGYLGAGLGVGELAVALHHVLDTRRDRLRRHVGHRSDPHKILTGRRHRSLRPDGGLSGGTTPTAGEYEPLPAAMRAKASLPDAVVAKVFEAPATDMAGARVRPIRSLAVRP